MALTQWFSAPTCNTYFQSIASVHAPTGHLMDVIYQKHVQYLTSPHCHAQCLMSGSGTLQIHANTLLQKHIDTGVMYIPDPLCIVRSSLIGLLHASLKQGSGDPEDQA